MTVSIVEETPTTIDPSETFRQLNYGDAFRMARLGARDAVYSKDDGYVQFDIKLTRKLRVIVKLNAMDTYDVEIGRYIPREMRYVVIEQVRGAYCDNIGQIVEDMAVKWSEAAAKTLPR